MAKQRDESHFSDLELLEHDTMARALHLFKDDAPGNAPEAAPEQWAPQAVLEEGNTTAMERPRGAESNSEGSQHYSSRVSKKVCWILGVCIVAAIIAVAVGVGVGIAQAQKHSTDTTSMSPVTPTATPTLTPANSGGYEKNPVYTNNS